MPTIFDEVEPLDDSNGDVTHKFFENFKYPMPIDDCKSFYNTKLLMSCYVASVGYHDIEEQWDELYIGKKLALIRQHNNEHDANAICSSTC